ELEALADEAVAILDGQPLGDFAELLPGLRLIPFRIEPDLLELLGVQVVEITIEPQREAVDLVAPRRAGDEGRREVVLERLHRRIAELLYVERREQVLREPGRHEPILADEAIRRGSGRESDAELL